ncbi:undecaprenyl/decaprenyl-phosphate alpha-N-acetylglucosaminyl 1-phosphate transferase [Echinicola marina]|uniref:MraY family glycosyltransferase n=1 Tax=Echinicola marina TaxID=2859768 RepID=UPI001CF66508|nr:MraY family glycosyltransferase [Echinicola marina]UCS93230.1 undecaprenyl/decaprenyl-phosphate alpha-N-acetylglucosaminyl 1-phosphate transferase [Echinicola marina]
MGFISGVIVIFSFGELGNFSYVLVSMGMLFSIGLWDDMKDLSAMQKLIGQLMAFFLVVILGDFRIHSFYGFLGVEELPIWISYSLSLFMLVGLTNAYNLIDGLDGLAGILGLISTGFMSIWFGLTGFYIPSLLCLSLSAAIIGFLFYNWHPAKIFMGDTGSLPLGLFIATMAFYFIYANGELMNSNNSLFRFDAPITTGLVMMVICCYDTLRVFVRRIRRGHSPFSPDKSHIHHFLMRMGNRHDQVAMMLGGLKLLFLALMIVCKDLNDWIMFPVVSILAISLGSVINVVTLRKVRAKVLSSPRVLSKSTYRFPEPVKEQNWEREKIKEY